MNHIGTHRLETERLILRRYALDDAPAMFKNWASDPEVTRYLTWPPHASVDVTRMVIQSWLESYEKPDTYHWGLELKQTGKLIGDIAVVRIAEPILEAEMGWCMGQKWWGNGYMPEAARAVLRCLFEEVGFGRVCAHHDTENPKSGRVMQKIGMTLEGVSRQGGHNNRGIVNVARYAILRSDWEENR